MFGGLDAGDSSDEDDGKVFFSGLNAGVKPDEKEGTIASGSPNEGNSSNDNDDIFAGVGPNPGDSAEENGNRNIFSGANAWESSGKAVGGVLLGGPNAGDSSDGEDCDGEVAGVGISYRLPMDSLAGIQLGPKVCSQGSVVRCERGSISDSGVKIFKKGSGKSEESEVEEESKKTGSRITRKIKTGFKGAGKNGSP